MNIDYSYYNNYKSIIIIDITSIHYLQDFCVVAAKRSYKFFDKGVIKPL